MTTEQQSFLNFLRQQGEALTNPANFAAVTALGRFLRDDVGQPIVDPFQRLLAEAQGAQYSLNPEQQATLDTLNQALLTADALSKTSAGATTESIIAPTLSGDRYGLGPNSFDSFLANLQQQRAQQDLLGTLTGQANRDAFRQTEFAPGVAPLIEAGSDATNLIPGAVFARGLGLGARAAPRAAGELAQSVVQTGARPIVTAAERGTAQAARSAEKQALNAREVIPFGPNRTKDGVPGGIPEGAAIDSNDPEEVGRRIDEITAELDGMEGTLVRPPAETQPWARRLTNQQLRALARHEGVNPSQQDWWDGLDPVVIREALEGSFRDATKQTIPELQRERNRLRGVLSDLEARQPSAAPAGGAEDVFEFDLETGQFKQVQGSAAPDAALKPNQIRADPQDLRSAQERISRVLTITEADATPEALQAATQERVREATRVRFQTGEAVKRLSAQLEQAQPLRPDQVEALRSVERSRRVGRLAGELESGQGTEAFARGASQLAGELPNPAFQPPVMAADDIFLMTEKIRTLPNTRPLTKLNTQNAFRHLLEGEVPTTSELILLEKAFGRELVESFLRRPRGVRGAATIITDILGIPKTIRSAFDLSAPLRQGLLLGPRNPREFVSALRDMFKSFNRQDAFAINREIFDDPDVQALIDKGLFLHNVEQAGPAALQLREEAFISRYAARVPGIGLSERTYGTFLNKLRADVAKKTLNNWRSQGVVIDDARLSALSDFINIFTGRGNLGKFENVGNTLNVAFWSPRLLVSRFQAPLLLRNPLVRRQAAENLVATFGLGITVLGIVEASRPGRQVEMDPRSTDFGKIRIGSTRVDFWGGFQQIARYMAQIATNQQKNPDTGEIYSPRDTDRFDRILAFGRSKASPGIATLLANELFGETFARDPLGEPPERGVLPDSPLPIKTGAEAATLETARDQEAIQQLAPLFALEVVNSMEENGIIGGALFSFPALFGVGVQTYNEEEAPAGTPQNRTGISLVPAR